MKQLSNQQMTRHIEAVCLSVEAAFARRKVTASVTGGQMKMTLDVDVSRVPGGLSHLAGELAQQLKAQRCAIRGDGERRLVIEIG